MKFFIKINFTQMLELVFIKMSGKSALFGNDNIRLIILSRTNKYLWARTKDKECFHNHKSGCEIPVGIRYACYGCVETTKVSNADRSLNILTRIGHYNISF